MNTLTIEEARAALALPRQPGARSVVVNGVMVSVCALNRIVRNPAEPSMRTEAVADVSGPPRLPITSLPDSEKTEASVLEKVTRFETRSAPLKMPEHTRLNGEHIKSYVLTYINKQGGFHCAKVAAKGMVTAITMFYMQHEESAIVSVVCVL